MFAICVVQLYSEQVGAVHILFLQPAHLGLAVIE
jgi:hypothetical protein